MVARSFAGVEASIRGLWSLQTCDPVDLSDWSGANPARGQCGATALVIQDLFGGELLMAEVHNPDGSRQGVHYWNRLGAGLEIDLTREQFLNEETIGPPCVITRPQDLTGARLQVQYETLAAGVRLALELEQAQ